jgi:hypothetical protein
MDSSPNNSSPIANSNIVTTDYGDNNTLKLSAGQKIGNYIWNIYFQAYGFYWPGFFTCYVFLFVISMLVLYNGNPEVKSVELSARNAKILKWFVISLLFITLLAITIFSYLFYKSESQTMDAPFTFEKSPSMKNFMNRVVYGFGLGSVAIYIIVVTIYIIYYEK